MSDTELTPKALTHEELLEILVSVDPDAVRLAPGWKRFAVKMLAARDAQWQVAIIADREKRAQGWLPIASAPEDGTWVLLYADVDGEPDVRAGFWGGFEGEEKSWSASECHSHDLKGQGFVPTYWMPLPAAPKASKPVQAEAPTHVTVRLPSLTAEQAAEVYWELCAASVDAGREFNFVLIGEQPSAPTVPEWLTIKADGSLESMDPYVDWSVGADKAVLDGAFTPDELRFLAIAAPAIFWRKP